MTKTESELKTTTCKWIGDGEGCNQPSLRKKSYCEVHHDRIYLVCPPEMADYILEKELKDKT